MNVEYSMPRECGNLISADVDGCSAIGDRSPVPTDKVSPTHPRASVVKIAARRVGAVRNAAAACDW